MSDSLRPRESQHATPPCSSPTPGVHSDVHQVSDAIQPSHPLLSPSPPTPIPPRIRVFFNESTLRIRWPKYWSFSFSIIPSNKHPGLISLQSKGLSRIFSNTTIQKHQFFGLQLLYGPNLTSIHNYWKNHSFN